MFNHWLSQNRFRFLFFFPIWLAIAD